MLWPRRYCVVVDGKVAVATQALLVRHWKLILPLEKGNEVSPSMRRRGENLWEETNGTFVGGHKFLTSRSSVVHTNCVHICHSVRSLSPRHFCATSTFCHKYILAHSWLLRVAQT